MSRGRVREQPRQASQTHLLTRVVSVYAASQAGSQPSACWLSGHGVPGKSRVVMLDAPGTWAADGLADARRTDRGAKPAEGRRHTPWNGS